MEIFNMIRNQALKYVIELPEFCGERSASGIYFVINQEQSIIYIGKSVDIKQRVSQHRTRFHDCVFLWKARDSMFCEIEEEEAFWISILRPRYNRSIRCKLHPNFTGYIKCAGDYYTPEVMHKLAQSILDNEDI